MDVALVAGVGPSADRASGIRAHVIGLANALADLGHAITIVGAGPHEQSPKYGWRFLPATTNMSPSSFRFLSALFLKARRLPINGHVVHAHRPDDLVPFRSRRDLHARVVTIHGLPMPGVTQRHGRFVGSIYGKLERLGIRQADRIVVLDSQTERDLGRQFPDAPRKIVRGSAGVDLNLFSPRPRSEARAMLGVEDGPTVAFVGRLAREKNLDTLLAAIPLLADIQFLVAGDGPLRPSLEAWGRRRAGFRFYGTVGPKDVAAILNAADVLAIPSEREAMPAICLEALACGTPVVATRIGGLREIVRDGVNGFFVEHEPGSIAYGLQRAVAQSGSMRAACRASVEGFGWPSVAGDLVRLYQEAAA